MGARQKLNGCYFLGSMCLAGVAGWLTASWLVLVIALAVLVSINLHNGDIRLRQRPDR